MGNIHPHMHIDDRSATALSWTPCS